MSDRSQIGKRLSSDHRYGALLIVAGALAVAHPAQAQLEICNNSAESISLTVAFLSDGAWVSRGWYNVDAGYCTNVAGGPLAHRYYYVRGEGANGSVWAGDDVFCLIHGSAFTIRGDADCAERGYRAAGFIRIDTGLYSRYRYNLSG